MSYTNPEDVNSPKDRWRLRKVLHNGGEGSWSAAEGEWDGEACLAIRWNGYAGLEMGHPQSNRWPTWFIVPGELEDAVRLGIRVAGAEKRLAEAGI